MGTEDIGANIVHISRGVTTKYSYYIGPPYNSTRLYMDSIVEIEMHFYTLYVVHKISAILSRTNELTVIECFPLQPAATVDLDAISSTTELEDLGLDALKGALQSRGLKCSGTLQDRAQRLWAIKGLQPDQIPASFFPKPAKGKGKKKWRGNGLRGKYYAWYCRDCYYCIIKTCTLSRTLFSSSLFTFGKTFVLLLRENNN